MRANVKQYEIKAEENYAINHKLSWQACLRFFITLVNVNAPVVATTSWWLHFTAPVVA